MKVLRRLMILPIILLLAQCQSDKDSFVRVFEDKRCTYACFHGLEPHVILRDDILPLLWSEKVLHSSQAFDPAGMLSYRPAEPDVSVLYTMPLEYDYLRYGEIYAVANENILMQISVPLRDIDVSTVVEWYGTPDVVLQGMPDIVMIYVQKGLAFEVRSDRSVKLAMLAGINTYNFYAGGMKPCTDRELCVFPRTDVPLVTDLTVIDAETGEPARSVVGQFVLDRFTSMGGLTVLASTDPAEVGSVVFQAGGEEFIDNTAPYEWVVPEAGSFLFTATPYSEPDGQGQAGGMRWLDLVVTEG